MSADALDDNFELDDGLVADEVDEEPSQAGPSKRTRVIDEEEEDDFVSGSDVEDVEAEGDEQSPPAKRTKIAKPTTTTQQGQQAPAMTAEEKKRKRKEKQKEAKKARLRPIDELEAAVDTSFISIQPPALQADFMAEMQIQAMPKLSAIEMEDFRIPEQYFVDTEHIESRKDLKAFIKQSTGLFEKELQTKGLPTGSPKLIIVSGAALRVADVVRDLRGIAGNGEVAKLFAKHFKLAEHCTYCKTTKFSIGAGTPDRIQKLIEADALRLDSFSYLVIDLKKDVKKRNLLDIPESRTALFKLLASPIVNNRLKEGKLKLVMY